MYKFDKKKQSGFILVLILLGALTLMFALMARFIPSMTGQPSMVVIHKPSSLPAGAFHLYEEHVHQWHYEIQAEKPDTLYAYCTKESSKCKAYGTEAIANGTALSLSIRPSGTGTFVSPASKAVIFQDTDFQTFCQKTGVDTNVLSLAAIQITDESGNDWSDEETMENAETYTAVLDYQGKTIRSHFTVESPSWFLAIQQRAELTAMKWTSIGNGLSLRVEYGENIPEQIYTVSASSQNGWKLKNASGTSISYQLNSDPGAQVTQTEFLFQKKDIITEQGKTISCGATTADTTGLEPGVYTDKVKFSVSDEDMIPIVTELVLTIKDDSQEEADKSEDGNKGDGNKDEGNKNDGNKGDGNKDEGNKNDGGSGNGNKDGGNSNPNQPSDSSNQPSTSSDSSNDGSNGGVEETREETEKKEDAAPEGEKQHPNQQEDANASKNESNDSDHPAASDESENSSLVQEKESRDETITPKELEQLKRQNSFKMDTGFQVYPKGEQIVVAWKTVDEADAYEIYGAYCGERPELMKQVSGKKPGRIVIRRIHGKKLDLRKNYKFYVKAYREIDGKKVCVGRTLMAHFAGAKNRKETNVKKIRVKEKQIVLKVGETKRIRA